MHLLAVLVAFCFQPQILGVSLFESKNWQNPTYNVADVNADCGCLIESSCNHGLRGLAAARIRELERFDQKFADMAFLHPVLKPIGTGAHSFSGGSCNRLELREPGVTRYHVIEHTNVSAIEPVGKAGFRLASSTMSVIAKRRASERNVRSDSDSRARELNELTRAIRAVKMRENVNLRTVCAKSYYDVGSNSLQDYQYGLPLMAKLKTPYLLSPQGSTPSTIRGELVARLNGLSGRYEMAKNSGPLLFHKREGKPEMDQVVPQSNPNDFHAKPKSLKQIDFEKSESWLEEGHAMDLGFVPKIAEFLTLLAKKGDRILENKGSMNSEDLLRSSFHAQRRPKVSLKDYCDRICKYGGCSPGCLLLGLIYMDRFLSRWPDYIVSGCNVHRLILSATLLATKQWDDTHFNNAFWAKVGGISGEELNSLEYQFASKIKWNLQVEPHDMEGYRQMLSLAAKKNFRSIKNIWKVDGKVVDRLTRRKPRRSDERGSAGDDSCLRSIPFRARSAKPSEPLQHLCLSSRTSRRTHRRPTQGGTRGPVTAEEEEAAARLRTFPAAVPHAYPIRTFFVLCHITSQVQFGWTCRALTQSQTGRLRRRP
eukprot:57962-Hanusia_phi.AAC.2